MKMTANDDESPEYKPTPPPHDRVIVLATLALGAVLVTIGHLNSGDFVATLGALGLFYCGFRD